MPARNPPADESLRQTLATLRERFGHTIVQPAARTRGGPVGDPVQRRTTGLPALDAALDGGLPAGRCIELIGVGTAGTHTLALTIAAAALQRHERVAFIDLDRTFDTTFAAACGVDVTRLLRVCPAHSRQALAIALTLVEQGAIDWLIFDGFTTLLAEPRGAQQLSHALRRLIAPLNRAGAGALFLATPQRARRPDVYANGTALPHYAALRLLVERQAWLMSRQDTVGYRVGVTVLKHKFGRAGQTIALDLIFNPAAQDTTL